MTPAERARVFWAERFQCAQGALVLPGLTLLARPERGYLYVLCTGESVVALGPETLRDSLEAVSTPSSLVTSEALSALLPPHVSFVGPACIAYLEAEHVRPEGIVTLESVRDERLSPLRGSVTHEEWRHANLEAAEPPLFACEHSGRIASVSGFERILDRVAHIGVITDPRARERGLGRRVTQAAAARALELGLLPQYQTLFANAGALRIGESLGFVRFATTLAARWDAQSQTVALAGKSAR